MHGFNDAAIIAGAGTVGREILEQVPDVEAIVTPVGGGGLIAGVALAVKELRPNVQIVGVEPERCPSLIRAIEQGRPVPAFDGPTLADGLAVPQVGDRAFAIARDRVDALVTVSEADISLAILRLVELEKGVVEGAGAVPLAAFLAGKLQSLRGKRVALLLCGGALVYSDEPLCCFRRHALQRTEFNRARGIHSAEMLQLTHEYYSHPALRGQGAGAVLFERIYRTRKSARHDPAAATHALRQEPGRLHAVRRDVHSAGHVDGGAQAPRHARL